MSQKERKPKNKFGWRLILRGRELLVGGLILLSEGVDDQRRTGLDVRTKFGQVDLGSKTNDFADKESQSERKARR